MNTHELRQKSRDELLTLLRQKRERRAELCFFLGQKKVKNVKEVAAVKKDAARILTLLHTSHTD